MTGLLFDARRHAGVAFVQIDAACFIYADAGRELGFTGKLACADMPLATGLPLRSAHDSVSRGPLVAVQGTGTCTWKHLEKSQGEFDLTRIRIWHVRAKRTRIPSFSSLA